MNFKVQNFSYIMLILFKLTTVFSTLFILIVLFNYTSREFCTIINFLLMLRHFQIYLPKLIKFFHSVVVKAWLMTKYKPRNLPNWRFFYSRTIAIKADFKQRIRSSGSFVYKLRWLIQTDVELISSLDLCYRCVQISPWRSVNSF